MTSKEKYHLKKYNNTPKKKTLVHIEMITGMTLHLKLQRKTRCNVHVSKQAMTEELKKGRHIPCFSIKS